MSEITTSEIKVTGSINPQLNSSPFLRLSLTKIPDEKVVGIYGEGKRHLPERMRYLHPRAAQSFLEALSPHVVVSDMFRSAESSLQAKRERRGAQPPSYSGHNYGFSIDVDVDKTQRKLGIKTKLLFDNWMIERGWYCHRTDHKRAIEAWHYNYFSILDAEYAVYVKPRDTRTSSGLERKITAYYGSHWDGLDNASAQTQLQRLMLYNGDIDGKFGPLSKEALRVFQRAWALNDSGLLDLPTRRTLSYVTADKIVC